MTMDTDMTMDRVSRYRFIPPKHRTGSLARAMAADLVETRAALAMLVAPSGFGKSVVMRQSYDRACERGEAQADTPRWLNLYGRPIGIERLTDYLTLSLKTTDPVGEPSALACGDFGIDDLLMEMDAIASRRQRILLYLDEVAEGDVGAVVALSRIIGRHFDENATIIASTRGTQPCPVGMEAERSLLLGPSELAFTTCEIDWLFEGRLSRQDVADLVAASGGWPGLIGLIRQRMTRRESLHGLAGRGTYDDLLAESVLDFADLNPASPDLEILAAAFAFGGAAGPIFDRPDFAGAGEVVARLARDGLIEVRVEGSDLVYRPHAAIQFAIGRFGRLTSRRRTLDLHRAIAGSLSESGDPLGAIRHALEAGDEDGLCELIETGGGWLLILQWGVTVIEAVNAIPMELLMTRPASLLARIYAMMFAQENAAARSLLDEIAPIFDASAFVDEAAFRSFKVGFGIIDALLRTYEMQPIDFALLEDLRGHCPADMLGPVDALIMHLKGAYQLRRGEVAAAQMTGQQAARKCQAAKANFVEAYVQLWLGHAHLQSGHIGEAGRCFEIVADIAETYCGPHSSQMVAAKIFLAELEFERGNNEKAYQIIDPISEEIEQLDPWYEMWRAFYRMAAYRALQQGGPRKAVSFLEASLKKMPSQRFLSMSAYLNALKVEMLLLGGGGVRAVESDLRNLDSFEPVESIFLAMRVRLWRGEIESFADDLDDQLSAPNVRGCVKYLITGQVLKASYLRILGREAEARSLIDETIELALQSNLWGHLSREFEAGRWSVECEFLSPLNFTISGFEMADAQEQEKQEKGFAPQLSPRERKVLAFIAEGLSSKEIASKLDLSLGTVLGYRKSLYRKIGVNRRSAAISFARQTGLRVEAEPCP